MKNFMDLHTHTVASSHAYSTIQENIAEAQRMGLKYLGISEHGPSMPDGPHYYFFTNYKIVPRQYGDLRLLCGIEANITDDAGGLDLGDVFKDRVDYVIASLHPPCITPGSRESNTRAAIQAMKNPYVKILGHPDDSRFPLDYDEVVKAALEEQVVLELNNASLHPLAPRKCVRENMIALLEKCMQYQAPVIMNTDSHISYSVGKCDRVLEVIEEVGFPEELILNYDPKNISKMININL